MPPIDRRSLSDFDSSTAPDYFDNSEFKSESEEELALEGEEEQLLPEYYVQEAESLDVSQFRQKRHSLKAQGRLSEMQDFWKR